MSKTFITSKNVLLIKDFKKSVIHFSQNEARISTITSIALVLVKSFFAEDLFTLNVY